MYVDGFVIPVPKANREAYRKIAAIAAPIFKAPCSLKMAVKCNDDETVVFSWIVWPSKAARDEGNAKAMADPRMQEGGMDCPFDGNRMIVGGFEVLLEV